ncbi:hypothetical protein ACFL1G_03100 [Planctomycetota bacterium]
MNSNKETPLVFEQPLFTKIFQTFRMAIRPGNLIICFLALLVICLTGLIMDVSKPVIVAKDIHGNNNELDVYINNPDSINSYIDKHKDNGQRTGMFSTFWHFAEKKFQTAVYSVFALDPPGVLKSIAHYFSAVMWAVKYHFIYTIIFFVIKLSVICIAGGAVCRMAAQQFAQGEKPGLTEAVRYSTKKFASFFTAPLVPFGIIIFMGFFIFLLGLIGNIPRVGELLMGIFMLLALFAGVLIAIVLIGAVAGFNLMYPAIAYDGSDCFDAISRAFSFIYSKPWRMGFYAVVAGVYGAICYAFVRFFAFLVLWVVHWTLELGIFVEAGGKNVSKLSAMWPAPQFANLLRSTNLEPANGAEAVAAFLFYIVLLAVIALLAAFIMSFFFSANTIIYALMRKMVDGTSLDDIYILPEPKEAETTETTPADETKFEEPEPEEPIDTSEQKQKKTKKKPKSKKKPDLKEDS